MRIRNMLRSKTNKSKLTISRLRKKVEKLEQEKMNMYEKVLSYTADLENYKKRAGREQLSFKKFANQELLQEILVAVDSLGSVIEYSNDSIAIEGVNLVLKEITRILKKFNVKPINAVMHQFDPNFHQAMSQEETDKYPDNTIIAELQKGYMIHDRLLRPSMVVVSTLRKESP